MGLASAQDEYGRRGDEAIAGLKDMVKVVDDILIFSKSEQAHIDSVIALLERFRKQGITLHAKKFHLGESTIKFCGYLVGQDGIEADPDKLDAIKNFPTPSNLTDLRSFMGLVNQLGSFTKGISEAAGPLRDLMRPKNVFRWEASHQIAFEKIKLVLTSPPLLAHFDPKLKTRLETDASRLNGLGFALRQLHGKNWKLVQCGSRFLSDTESRYAMIELELLGVVWAMKKSKMYLLG